VEKQAFKSCFFVLLGFMLILFSIFIIQLYRLSNALNEHVNTEILTFSNGEKIFIKAKVWGISGNHEEIVFSETPINIPNKERDYIFYTSEVFYEVNKNTLTIYAPQSGKSIPATSFKDVVVIFKGLKKADEIRDYSFNYQEYGLQRISVFK
jgi:hypothetical protein